MKTKAGSPVVTPRAAMVCLLGVLLLTVITTFDRYGFTIDEDGGLRLARKILSFLSSGGTDKAAVGEFTRWNFYGGMADVLALLLQDSLPFLTFDSRHLVTALFGIAGIYYAYRLADYLAGHWAGPVAAVLLVLNPMWFGYMFINIKDIPFATAFLALSYHMLRLLADGGRPSWRSWLGVGLWSGLLATTKLLGPPMVGVAVFVMLTFVWMERRNVDLRAFAVRVVGGAAVAIIGVVACSVFFWPQLFLYRPDQLWEVMQTFFNYTPWHGKVLLNGAVYDWNRVPRTYLITYFVISMPLTISALYLVAGPLAIWKRRVAMLGPVLVPVPFFIVQAAMHLQVYNGYRHFLFVVPFIAVAAGFAFTALAQIGRRFSTRAIAVGLLALFAGVSTYNMARLFPYQYSSYNMLVGGTSGAQGRFYIDVWRSAQREALRLTQTLAAPPVARLKVFSCGSPLNFSGLPRVRPVGPDQADFVIALPRGCPVERFPQLEVIKQVRRGDVVFASILSRPGGILGPSREAVAGEKSEQHPDQARD